MNMPPFFEELVKKTARRFPDKIKPIYLKARKLMEQYCAGESEKPVEVRAHTVERIFPAIAIYKSIIEVTGQKDKAYDIVCDVFESFFQNEDYIKHLRKLSSFPGGYHLVPMEAAKAIKKHYGEKAGFKLKVHNKGSKHCHIDVMECPYARYCRELGCEELTAAFCDAADVALEYLHRKVSWDRTRTMGRGDDYCDLILGIDD